MQLTYLYHPVKDIAKAVAFYRDVLGWDESWRMGDDTAAMQIPNSTVTVMLAIDSDPSARASGFFGVDDIDAFYRDNRDRIDFIDEPQDLPPIRYTSFRDPDDNLFRLYTDMSTDEG
ncbi:MAG TPA: VOC family protein [Acidimicrobiia bacterium]|nr:VOC family protein [Acidimicrobiia bacterium]